MIKVNKITPQVFEHFNSESKSLGFLNEYESLDLRVQIAKEKHAGYYLLFNDRKLEIDSNGKLSSWPVGLYDVIENTMTELFTIQRRNV